MKRLNGREMKALFALSIIVPVSLLATLRLTGILQGPITITETKTSEAIEWECERFNEGIPVLLVDPPESVYRSHEISVIQAFDYAFSSYFLGDPVLFLGLNLTAAVENGFIANVKMTFRETYLSSAVNFWPDVTPQSKLWDDYLENLAITDVIEYPPGNEAKASISLAGIDRPRIVYLGPVLQPSKHGPSVGWWLNSPRNFTHQFEIVSEVIYCNGTVNKKVVQPFRLKFGPDENNSFEAAQEIGFGSHKAYIDGKEDSVDYYKVWLKQGQMVQIGLDYPQAVAPQEMGVELYLYDTNKELRESLLYRENATRHFVITSDTTGWWYIRTKLVVSPYIYVLTIIPVTEGG